MQVDRLYTALVRLWLLLCGLLGMTSYYYSSKRRQLVHSTWLRIYSGSLIIFSLGGYYFYFNYGLQYFVPSYFPHYEFVNLLCLISMSLQFVVIVNQSALRLTKESEIGQLCNQLMSLYRRWGLRHSCNTMGKGLMLAKTFSYVTQITSPLVGVLIVVETRGLTSMDIFCNLYFIYNLNLVYSHMFAYMLMLLQCAETMRLNVAAEGRVNFWTKLRRHVKLWHMTQRVHRLFAPEILAVLLSQLFSNTCTFYLGYSISRDGEFWNFKVQLTAFSFLIKLLDILLIQLVCEHLLVEEKQLNTLESETDYHEWEMAQLMHATLFARGPPKHVLGMFSLDKRCAFNIMSSSLGYAIIIMQIGYIHR